MKWKKIGDILVVDKDFENPQELLEIHKVKSVIKLNKIHGQMRKSEIEILLGCETETIHKENGIYYKLDLAKVMWSKGNVNERLRIAKLVSDGEVVLDMFAGIGYFSIPIGKYSNLNKIYSIEINPDSFRFLKENIAINNVEDKVEAILGDSSKLNSLISSDIYFDRIIMGYVKTTHNFLKLAINRLKKGGVIHYHETTPDKLINTRPINRIKEIAINREVELLNIRKIKSYSPGVSHIVCDIRIY